MKRSTIFLGFCIFLISCNNNQQQSIVQKDTIRAVKNVDTVPKITANLELPFVGKRQFETRAGISGTGTASKYVEIKSNGDVYFSFDQPYIDSDSTRSENFYAGKFSKYLKCECKMCMDTVSIYEITKEKIYEVDKNHKRLNNADCCESDNEGMGDKCPCESLFSDFE